MVPIGINVFPSCQYEYAFCRFSKDHVLYLTKINRQSNGNFDIPFFSPLFQGTKYMSPLEPWSDIPLIL